ncbi:transglycosylase domain-containing protein [Jidongwangia harbinensis]|uniref:transglycosylase domain-containing protein n=1 Tax=Jidongwangia harbinensis TaxID=2878561 RepID=UPI001CD93A08|nr:transglycosylase domain-containing protein [Jidongwangia harbinensis]MCA2213313.1 penicillin-binding protein [Jidongwangia harbinensis]
MVTHRAPSPRWRRLRRWTLRAVAATAILSGLAGAAASGYVAAIDVPPDPAPPQASVLYYRDGRTVLARIGTANRTDVPLARVPTDVRRAFLAAEDRGFYHHPGVSVRGVLRAVWSNLSAGSAQGASTITQQYVRNAYLTQDRTLNRKAKEAALALRLERQLTKDELFERYLNTIYFGRGAYGIESAAHAYFGTRVDRLTGVQGAVLAALIKNPWLNDPTVDAQRAENRWRWILRSMAGQDWLDPAAAESATYPKVAERSPTAAAVGGPAGIIADRVEAELDRLGVASQLLRTGGLQVVTTVDRTAQQAAETVVRKALKGQAKTMHAALVAVDPATGAVRAYYGGDDGRGYYDDAMAPRPPASTFKPIALAAGELAGMSYRALWDGTSPRQFTDRQGVPLRNRNGLQCPVCPLDVSMVHSLNTPFYALAEKVGPAQVRDLAVRLGVPEQYGDRKTLVDLPGEPTPGQTRADIALGRYPVSPADLATVYGTFAAGGLRAERHLVQSVAGADGSRWHQHKIKQRRVLDAAVAADVGVVLSGVVDANGTVRDRPAAAKTGSQQWGNSKDTSDAWTAGYAPQLAAAIWVGRREPGPIRDARQKNIPVNGDGIPYRIWREFLGTALAGRPATPLAPPGDVGDVRAGDSKLGAKALSDSFPYVGMVFDADGNVVGGQEDRRFPLPTTPDEAEAAKLRQQRELDRPRPST